MSPTAPIPTVTATAVPAENSRGCFRAPVEKRVHAVLVNDSGGGGGGGSGASLPPKGGKGIEIDEMDGGPCMARESTGVSDVLPELRTNVIGDALDSLEHSTR